MRKTLNVLAGTLAAGQCQGPGARRGESKFKAASMPTIQELHAPHPPLEGTSFLQADFTGEDTTLQPQRVEGAANDAHVATLEREESEREKGKGRTKRKSRPATEPEEAALDSTVKESTSQEKRVKFNIEGTGGTEETPPLDVDVDIGSASHDDATTHNCNTGESSGDAESELAPPPGEDVETCIKRITSETQIFFSKWKETLQESEAFESFFPSRIDELIKEAYALEESLKEKKEAMRKRLTAIASTLECFGNS